MKKTLMKKKKKFPYKNTKKDSEKKHMKDIKLFLKKKKKENAKKSETDTKIFLKNKTWNYFKI